MFSSDTESIIQKYLNRLEKSSSHQFSIILTRQKHIPFCCNWIKMFISCPLNQGVYIDSLIKHAMIFNQKVLYKHQPTTSDGASSSSLGTDYCQVGIALNIK